ncbi:MULTISPECIES: hypothetical protein [Bacteria]|uniref:hypothetical protein n=1 Tax=Bacteria TaxID=2 RepID=UPI002E7BF667|nr:hypothetical protein [Cetobacterium somerae]WVJ03144.1 hypothetical protein VSU16_14565 [Cetobacterium somerae]
MNIIETLKKLPQYEELKNLTVNKYIKGDSPNTSEILNFIKKYGAIGFEIFKAHSLSEGLYCYPTKELELFLKEEISNYKNPIEIGAGNGYLNKIIGIRGTDSMIQLTPSIKAYYELNNHYPLNYINKNIEKLTDLESIEKYKPDLVIASWVTQKTSLEKYDEGFIHGVQEIKWLEENSVKKYIFIGNFKTHMNKNIFDLKELEKIIKKKNNKIGFDVEFILGGGSFSRSELVEQNFISVITKNNSGEVTYKTNDKRNIHNFVFNLRELL